MKGDQNVVHDLAIVGAGPIGVDIALRAVERGWDIRWFEADQLGSSLRQWHGVTMFTPFRMNVSEHALRFAADNGLSIPDGDTYLMGMEFVEQWLEPVVYQTELDNELEENTLVEGITREDRLKGDGIGNEDRRKHPFRLIIRNNNRRSSVRSRYVIDVSGTFSQPNYGGSGGVPAPGELEQVNQIEYGLPSPERITKWNGKRILLVGGGYTAATNLKRIDELTTNETKIFWVVRSEEGKPIKSIPDDPLDKRVELSRQANGLADGDIELVRQGQIDKISRNGNSLTVELTSAKTIEVDQILINTGFRPDRSIYRELQVHECYATEGPIDLAASLMSNTSSDCLKIDSGGVDQLTLPEPNFYILGSKSYGRNSNFLLRTGYQQLDDLFDYLDSKNL